MKKFNPDVDEVLWGDNFEVLEIQKVLRIFAFIVPANRKCSGVTSWPWISQPFLPDSYDWVIFLHKTSIHYDLYSLKGNTLFHKDSIPEEGLVLFHQGM